MVDLDCQYDGIENNHGTQPLGMGLGKPSKEEDATWIWEYPSFNQSYTE